LGEAKTILSCVKSEFYPVFPLVISAATGL
jgi:hypothetical protein